MSFVDSIMATLPEQTAKMNALIEAKAKAAKETEANRAAEQQRAARKASCAGVIDSLRKLQADTVASKEHWRQQLTLCGDYMEPKEADKVRAILQETGVQQRALGPAERPQRLSTKMPSANF